MESVAIIIPVFNSSKYLKECLNSVLNQTYTELEIIIVDDGSTDNSLTIIEEYSSLDSRIKYKSILNSGVSVARNTGIEMAESNYIVFVDSDDYIDPFLIETLIRDKDVDFVLCGYEVENCWNNKSFRYVCPQFNGNISDFCNRIIDYLTPPFLLGPCFKLFKKELIICGNIRFPIDISYGEDAEFVLSYLEYVNTVCCKMYVGYSYRHHDNESLSQRFRPDKMDIYKRINTHIIDLVKKKSSETCVPSIYKRYIQNFVEYSHELFAVKLPLSEKKKMFYSKGIDNNILAASKYAEELSIAQKLVAFALKYHCFWPIYIVFSLRDRLVKRVE